MLLVITLLTVLLISPSFKGMAKQKDDSMSKERASQIQLQKQYYNDLKKLSLLLFSKVGDELQKSCFNDTCLFLNNAVYCQ